MSVYKSKRSTSAIQYVENARQLQVFTIKNCVKFPKRYTYIVVQKIANLVEDIDTHVRVAESMMPTNLHEAQLKRDELTYTFGLLNSLDDKLQLMYDIVSDNPNFKTEFKWLPNAMLEWGRLIQKERDLITGVKKADRKRFKEKFKEYEDNSIPTNVVFCGLLGCCGGSANNWWERSPNSGNSNNFCNVNSNGNANNNNANNSNGVAFGFCRSIGQSK